MISFYYLLFVLVAGGAIIGYRIGFVAVIMFLMQLVVPAIIAFLWFIPLGEWLKNNLELAESLILPTAFCTLFVAVFLLLFFVFHLLLKKSMHKANLINRVCGTFTGIIAGCSFILLLHHFTSVVAIPQPVEAVIAKTEIPAWLHRMDIFVDREASIVFETPTQVMAAENEIVSHDAVLLPFVTSEINFRADLEMQMLALVNAERKSHGLKILQYDASLTIAARDHSADMFKRGYFSHNTPEGINPFQRLHKAHIRYRYAGENLALAPTLLKAHEELMKSPGHRANILNPAYGRIGIGIAAGGDHGLMVTQEFRD